MSPNPSVGPGSGALVSCRGHLSWLDTIRTHLSVENRLLFNDSCFGHFLSIPDLQFQGQLYHVLISKLEKSSLSQQRLSFCINNRVIEFGPREFSVITGLRMCGWEELPTDSDFHETYFRGKTNLVFSDIQKSFIRECEATDGNSLESLKLAFLYIVYGILLIRSRRSKTIDLKYLHLVDDLEKFNMFAWGQVSYEFLVRTAHRARDILDNLIAEGKKLAYDANGFAVALQTWAYEVMPNLARGCAMRVPGVEEQIPRILRWTSNKHYRFQRINGFFNAKNAGEFPVEMLLSDQEQRAIALLGVNDITSGPLARSCDGEVMYKHRRLPKKSAGHALDRKRPRGVESSVCDTSQKRGTIIPAERHPETNVMISCLLERVDRLERALKGLKTSVSDLHPPKHDASLNEDDHTDNNSPGGGKSVIATPLITARALSDSDNKEDLADGSIIAGQFMNDYATCLRLGL